MISQFGRAEPDGDPQLVIGSREVKISWIRKAEVPRHDAYHRIACTIQKDGLIQDARVRCEAAHPQVMSHHHNARAAGYILVGRERAAEGRADAQQGE